MYAAGQPFPDAGWFLYRLNLDDESAVAYIEEMIPLRCAPHRSKARAHIWPT